MKTEQFVMAYSAEQDRIRAMLPDGFESLRPVLRINAEIRTSQESRETEKRETAYIELNTPAAAFGRRGWLNIAAWESPETEISYTRNGSAVTFSCPFLEITFTGVGIEGGCPAEKDNDGCFFLSGQPEFVEAEKIEQNKEFCDCAFSWKFSEGDAHGVSSGGKSVAAKPDKPKIQYEKCALSAENAAKIECRQILGAYTVKFQRQ